MAKYKVKVIAHQLKGNIIAKAGDIVDEVQLDGNASELAKAGFVELVQEEKPAKEVKEEKTSKVSK